MTWNQQQEEADAEEKIDRCVKFADHVALVVSERKRALEACHKAQQLQAELDALKAAHNWIKTSERMPEPETVVLIVCTHDFADGEICTAKCYLSVRGSLVWEYYDTETGEAGKDIADKWVPCWMPLPDMPEALK